MKDATALLSVNTQNISNKNLLLQKADADFCCYKKISHQNVRIGEILGEIAESPAVEILTERDLFVSKKVNMH